ncbi:hypothetical protein [Streptomyces formicae]|uniref:Adhesin n=1 Tax=Streptomyces formicae TaxID=1616117 RepID=A0ABY3WNS2_9ACTN|nr:hypothetical protein [Streptomyces formicae]UNM12432.1 hypothetical protein J4032_13605 [Streptomyces formicae]
MQEFVTPLPGWRGGDGNAAYLDKTLRHQAIELALNESVSAKTIFFLWLRAAMASFVVFAIPCFIGVISLISAAAEESDYYGESSDGSAGGGWITFGFMASFVVFWIVLLMTRLPEPVGEWRVLLADRTDRVHSVYSTIAQTLSARRYPIAPAAHGTRITLNDPPYTAYVSVFNYGTSLYLGWMMWRSRRGTDLMGQFITDFFRGLRGENGIEHQLLRSEGARAMREAVHLACREGLMVALENAPATHGTVPPQVPPTAPPSAAPPVAPPVVPPVPTRAPHQYGGPGMDTGTGTGTGTGYGSGAAGAE